MKMRVFTSSFVFLTVLSAFLNVQCTEFVPVYSWGNFKSQEKVPALPKISQDSFKDSLLEELKNDLYLVVFAEQTLSPEDFVQKNSDGEIAFPKLSALKQTSPVEYKPAVQNPIKAFKHLNKDVEEISIDSLKTKFNIPKTNILIVDLNDAGDDEPRFDLLNRHDELINKIYNQIKAEYSNVMAIYTAHHTSWVSSEDEDSSRQRRDVANATEDPIVELKDGYLYSTNATVNYVNSTLTWTSTVNETGDVKTFTVTGTATEGAVTLIFEITPMGYMELVKATLRNVKTSQDEVVNGISYIHAPVGFSYHCANQTFKTKGVSMSILDFQIQLFMNMTGNSTDKDTFRFGDAYDCVGFTSAPIWSGLFVTFILLFIMTLGLTMMMDIKTMDRFDDAKGKTITINAEG